MKKKLLVIGLYSLTSVMMFSCKKDDPTPVTTELPTKFSSKSTEENKAQLETNGIQLINDLEALKTSKGVEAVSSLSTFMNSGGSSMRKSSAGNLLSAIKNLRQGTGSSDGVFTSMRLSQEYGSIKEVYYNNAGTYTWNTSINDFDYVQGGNQIIYKFPSTETGTSNNAVLTIKDYQGIVTSTTYLNGYTGDLPTKLLMDLTVDGSKVLDYTFGATYNDAGEPTSVNSKLTVAPFAFSVSMTNNTEVAGFEYSFTKDSKILISFGASAKGNFKTNDNDGGELYVQDIHEGTAHFQLLNIKIGGTIDVAAINNELDANPSANQEELIRVC